MDYRQDDFYRLNPRNFEKMPFYMTYPMQNAFLEEAEYERDMDRLKGFYPREVRQIQDLVEEECDKMEYEGSLMFDEYPDRMMLRKINDRIYQQIVPADSSQAEEYEMVESEELRMAGPGRRPDWSRHNHHQGRPPRDTGMSNLIEVLLFNEMFQRRCRHKRCRRWW